MSWLSAAPHRLTGLFPDCFQLELSECSRLLTLNLPEATLLRVAAHAGTAEELLLRFVDAGRCAPDQGREALQRGLEQGWLRMTEAAQLGWDDTPQSAGDAWRCVGELPQTMHTAGSAEDILVCEFLDGLNTTGNAPLDATEISPLQLLIDYLARLGQQPPRALLSSSRTLSRLFGPTPPVLLQFSTCLSLPGPTLSPPAAQSHEDECLLLNTDASAARLALACGPLAAAALRQLDPSARCLTIPVRASLPAPAPGQGWARLAILGIELPDSLSDFETRARLLVMALDNDAALSDAELTRQLQRSWLQRWNAITQWQQVYGLPDDSPATCPVPEPGLLPAIREQMASCAGALRAAT